MRLGLCFLMWCVCCGSNAAELKTRNVFLIISDGLRWEEVFNGAERDLMSKEGGGVKNTNSLSAEFWRETPEARREALLPFFWGEIARNGQLLGNQAKGSIVTVSNGKNFSYPGYNEIVTGRADARIDSNDKKANPNTNVFEWLSTRRGFRNKVAVLGTWDVFPYIFNINRSGLAVWPAWEAQFKKQEIEVPRHLSQTLSGVNPLWDDVIQDGFLFQAVLHHVEKKRPRLMFVGFGETDEWAHAGRYDLYLRAAHRLDQYVRRLWELVQSHSQYKNRTTFIVTADHGRGSGREGWKGHGEKVKGSEGDWLVVIGPDTLPLGERTDSQSYNHGQIAATIGALLGENYQEAFPGAGAPMLELLER